MLSSTQNPHIFTKHSSIPRLLENIYLAIIGNKSVTVAMFNLPGIFNAVKTKTSEATATPTMLLNGCHLPECTQLPV